MTAPQDHKHFYLQGTEEKNARRDESIRRVRAAAEDFSALSERVLGVKAHVALAAELECVGVIDSADPAHFPLKGSGDHNALPVFQNSPIIGRIDDDEVVHTRFGATGITHDGRFGKQLEIVTRPHTPRGRRIAPEELARILEIVTKMLPHRAPQYRLSTVDFRSVPYRSLADQASSCQWNINIESENGTNLFDNGKGYESALHLLFVDEFLRFEKEGGLLISVPSPEAFERIGRGADTEPKQHFVGKRKAVGNFPSFFLRGPNRDVARAEDPRPHKHVDKGGVRTEKRAGAPGSVMAVPEASPSLMIETILAVATRTLERYEQMSQAERDALTPESLWSIPPQDFPRRYDELYDQFKASAYIQEHYASLRSRALEIIAEPVRGATR